MSNKPLIMWFRRDLRLADHPAVQAALATGRPVVPVFVLDAQTEALGAAARFRLGLGLAQFAAALAAIGSKLVLRRGEALAVLRDLVAETGAEAVYWQRLYDPKSKARDAEVKAALRAQGLEAKSFDGALLIEPWQAATGQGGYYKVYSPFWRAVSARGFDAPRPMVRHLPPPTVWPVSEVLEAWRLGLDMRRGGAIVARHQRVGEAAALARLEEFTSGAIADYRALRDFPDKTEATSGLSENLAWGEIGPRTIWAAGQRAMHQGAAGAEHFCKELVWREFAYHLLHHSPELETKCWRPEWEGFDWRGDNADAERWRRGMTGEPFVDAAMREVYVTGRMHNRARMIVASYLTKHLMTDWRVGQAWFAEVLTDWDVAANAMGWQWVAGCGPDAAPYFRVFNPAGQAEKFDESKRYRHRWIAEGQRSPAPEALAFFEACPHAWGLDPAQDYPAPLVNLAEGRARALLAYAEYKGKDAGDDGHL